MTVIYKQKETSTQRNREIGPVKIEPETGGIPAESKACLALPEARKSKEAFSSDASLGR